MNDRLLDLPREFFFIFLTSPIVWQQAQILSFIK